jgi:hypothetical protein
MKQEETKKLLADRRMLDRGNFIVRDLAGALKAFVRAPSKAPTAMSSLVVG